MTGDGCSALILAAGKGTRMKSPTAKVMQPLLEEPMLFYLLASLKGAGIQDLAVVLGHGGEEVERWLAEQEPSVTVLWQREQLGTGHAVMVASEWLRQRRRVLVVNGDMPMLRQEDIAAFLEGAGDAPWAFGTCLVDDPGQYGRVIRQDSRVRIVEYRDATERERQVREINAGLYCFDGARLLEGLEELRADNSQGEYYIVDLIPYGVSRGDAVAAVPLSPDAVAGINDPWELAQCTARMRDRILKHWMSQGVKCLDPQSLWISPRATFQGECWIYPSVQIWGDTSVGADCFLGSNTVLRNCVLGRGVRCLGNVVAQEARIDDGATLGPFCFLRDHSHVQRDAVVGKFVEIKKSHVGPGAKVPHLSYIGDAVIGEGTNVGAATVTCNYDGVHKHPTTIGAHCFIGSDTMLVAPVTVGDGAVIAAGSVITSDVPAGALAVARGRQRIVDDWARRRRRK